MTLAPEQFRHTNSDERSVLRGRRFASFIVALSIVATATMRAGGQATFEFPVSFGGFNTYFAVGDFDGDGDKDLYLGQAASGTVMLNDGHGIFRRSPASWIVTSNGAIAQFATLASVIDVDGDGREDLVIKQGFPHSTLIVLRSNGSSFEIGSPLLLPLSVDRTRPIHADNDGFDDILLIDNESNGTSYFVLRGSASGDLVPVVPSNFIVPTVTGTVRETVADFDLDGDDDVALRLDNGFLRIFRNDSATLVLEPPISAAPGLSSGFGSGDLDEDGDADLLFTSVSTTTNCQAVVAFNDGQGSFNFGPAQTYPPNGLVFGSLADADGDGHLDIVNFPQAVEIAYGRGDGTFDPAVHSNSTMSSASQTSLVALTDLDGEGGVEAVAGNRLIFPSGRRDEVLANWVSHGNVDTDWDFDGDVDVVDLETGPPYTWSANDGRGRLTPMGVISIVGNLPSGLEIRESLPVDVDGDGDLDVIAELFSVTVNTGTGQSTATYVSQLTLINDRGRSLVVGPTSSSERIPAGLRAADLDQDGHPDLAADGRIWYGDGTGAFTAVSIFGNWTIFDAGDIEGDGDIDLLIGRTLSFGHQYSAILFDPTAPPVEVPFLSYPGSFPGQSLLAARLHDVDGDGDLDVAAIERSGGGFSLTLRGMIVENRGFDLPTVRFLSPVPVSGEPDSLKGVAIVDSDGDGRMEFYMHVVDALFEIVGTHVFEDQGPSEPEHFSVYQFPPAFRHADVDGDGDLDVVVDRIITNRSVAPVNGGGVHRQYGTSVDGSDGFAPLLGVRGTLRPGDEAEVVISRALGGTVGFLAVGLFGVDQPGQPAPGLTTYVDGFVGGFWFEVSGPVGLAGIGGGVFPAIVSPGLDGVRLYLQAAFYDPQGPLNVSMTNGLEVQIGR